MRLLRDFALVAACAAVTLAVLSPAVVAVLRLLLSAFMEGFNAS